jgi:hypothetical protein
MAVMTNGIVCESVIGLIVFFSDSIAKGFLQTGASSEYRLNLQTTKYKSRLSQTRARASFSSMAPEIFWPAGCQSQPMFWSQRPDKCVIKLQIGTQKQILPQLDLVDFGVHDMEEARLSHDQRRQVACA